MRKIDIYNIEIQTFKQQFQMWIQILTKTLTGMKSKIDYALDDYNE